MFIAKSPPKPKFHIAKNYEKTRITKPYINNWLQIAYSKNIAVASTKLLALVTVQLLPPSSRLTFSCSKSTIETVERGVLVFLLLTLNMFNNFFYCFFC